MSSWATQLSAYTPSCACIGLRRSTSANTAGNIRLMSAVLDHFAGPLSVGWQSTALVADGPLVMHAAEVVIAFSGS